MSSNNSGGSGGSGKGEFPITITARDVGLDASILKLTRFSDAMKNVGMNIQNSMRMINGFGRYRHCSYLIIGTSDKLFCINGNIEHI